jgi:hypothetical protein
MPGGGARSTGLLPALPRATSVRIGRGVKLAQVEGYVLRSSAGSGRAPDASAARAVMGLVHRRCGAVVPVGLLEHLGIRT